MMQTQALMNGQWKIDCKKLIQVTFVCVCGGGGGYKRSITFLKFCILD